MNEGNTVIRTSNEAIVRLQENRKAVGKGMLIVLAGAFFLAFPPLGLLIIFFGYRKVQKAREEMKGLYKDAFVREPLANNFENVIYEPGNGFTREDIESFRVCMMGNRYWTEDYISAEYAGVRFEISQVNVRQVVSDDKSETYFAGRIMAFNFPDKLVSQVAVFSRKFKYRPLSRSEEKATQVELESMEFNREFDVYSPVQQDAFYLITPHFEERLCFLAGKYDSIAMNVVGNRVILAFNEPGNNAFDAAIDVGQLDIEKEMAKVQAEIDDIKLFISMILNLRTGS
ncbi:MAG: DUF3137 domain-containing protein [Lachnospiraceae bacterium]|nr:DUF3137 domain-containing protein [Lachnospiraceae bacterium]